ncbi:uncharacterized protein ACNLHF_028338 [Anomaloglossus baeobatrachus]
MIRNADKGGGIVLQNRNTYLQEAVRNLSNELHYEVADMADYNLAISNYHRLINKASNAGILNKDETKFLTIKDPKMAFYYHLPKIHKNLENPPGRPIISGIDSLTANLAAYIDRIMRIHVTGLRSHLRDSTDLINVIKTIEWKDSFVFLTLDISALYTNISHRLGLECFKQFLMIDERLPEGQKEFLLEGMEFILSNNYFTFQNTLYHQCCGTAMGSKVAPTFANLFMGMFELMYIYNSGLFKHVIVYRRFIDDLFLIWDNSGENVGDFLGHLDNNSWGLTFSPMVKKDSIDFLDLTITHTEGVIHTKTFFKKVDSNGYIHVSSNHYNKWLLNVPRNQFQRVRRNCTLDVDFKIQANTLKERFLDKDYPLPLIKKAYQANRNLTQCDLIKPAVQSDMNSGFKYTSNFLITYSNDSSLIRGIIKKHWGILFLKGAIPEVPGITYRRASTLRNQLAPSRLRGTNNLDPENDIMGSFKCMTKNCLCCKSIQHKRLEFSSTTGGEIFRIRSHLTCQSDYVIYLIECECSKQYIGRTSQALHNRVNSHRHRPVYGIKSNINLLPLLAGPWRGWKTLHLLLSVSFLNLALFLSRWVPAKSGVLLDWSN